MKSIVCDRCRQDDQHITGTSVVLRPASVLTARWEIRDLCRDCADGLRQYIDGPDAKRADLDISRSAG